MIAARYFDGQTAKAHQASVTFVRGSELTLQVYDEQNTLCYEQALVLRDFEESFKGSAQRINLKHGGALEFADKIALRDAIDALGVGPLSTPIERVQNSWRWVIASIFGLVAFAALMFWVVIPWGSSHVTAWLPATFDKRLGDEAWPGIERQLFTPTKLSAARQEELRNKFTEFTRTLGDMPAYQLEFRDSPMGPNAIALPGGRIVFTDALIKLADNDDALIGVFAHELGHVRERHSMRQIVQATAMSALLSAWLGDLSSLITIVPSTLATMKYTRDMEYEADDFALAQLKRAKVDASAVARLFAKLPQSDKSIFSTHPGTQERIKRFEGTRH